MPFSKLHTAVIIKTQQQLYLPTLTSHQITISLGQAKSHRAQSTPQILSMNGLQENHCLWLQSSVESRWVKKNPTVSQMTLVNIRGSQRKINEDEHKRDVFEMVDQDNREEGGKSGLYLRCTQYTDIEHTYTHRLCAYTYMPVNAKWLIDFFL